MADSLITILKPKLDEQQEEELRRENQARYLANQSLGGVAGYMSARGGEMLGRNAAGLGGELMGIDARSGGEKQRDAVEQVKAEVAKLGFDPQDPKSIDRFYREVIRLLQQRGLVTEAMAVAKEYQTQKAAMTRADAAMSDVQRKAANDKERADIARAALGAKGPKVFQYMDRLQEVENKLETLEADAPEAEQLKRSAETLKALIARESEGKIRVQDLNDRVVILDSAGGTIREIAKGKRPGTAGSGGPKEPKLSVSERERARLIELEKMEDEGTLDAPRARELELLRAKLKGALEDKGKAMTAGDVKDVASGLATIKTFAELARTFRPSFSGGMTMKAAVAMGLEDKAALLKRMANVDPAASVWWQRYFSLIAAIRNALFGASLTEGESQAFQQIKASLGDNPRLVLQIMKQQADDALVRAQTRVEGLQGAGFNVQQLPSLLQTASASVQGMPATVGGAPTTVNRPAAPAAAPAAPAAAPAAPSSGTTAPDSGTVRVRHPDGRTGKIPRANLEAAKAAGFQEIK